MDPRPALRHAALLLPLALGLTGCPQPPVTLAVRDEVGQPTRCELRVPNRRLDEVANEFGERMGMPVTLGEGVDGGRRVDFSAEAPTCRAAIELFAAAQGLGVREVEEERWTRLEFVVRP